MYRKHGAAGGGAIATTGAPHLALYIAIGLVLVVAGLSLYRTAVVRRRSR